jgi:hypothetical protein
VETSELRLDVFGRRMTAVQAHGHWSLFLLGPDGKRRPADISIPSDLSRDEIPGYLADIFHEIATPRHNQVRVLP